VTFDESNLLAAGRGADGTVYVVTQDDSTWRLFRTDEDGGLGLFGLGRATTTSDAAATVWNYWEWGRPVSVGLVRDAAGQRMAVMRGATSHDAWHLTQGEQLTVLTAAQAASLTATFTRSYSVKYSGTAVDGRALVVTGPEHPWVDFKEFRVFWGKPGDLHEHVLTSLSRTTNDGKLTYDVTFETDSGSARLSSALPVPYPETGDMSEGTLELGGETETLTGSVPPEVPDSARFFCL
jgi:hypothetical protein